ncbi:MAG: hypothetical protein ABIH18_05055 [Candidatus Omnitrophota bacterium]
MKAFFIGLLFLLAVAILSGIGFLLFPVLIILGWFLRFFLMLGFVILAIWLLGKLIILILDVIIKK